MGWSDPIGLATGEIVLDQIVSLTGEDALRMELHTFDLGLSMTYAHDHTVDAACGYLEDVGD